ncbi:DUF805 domain-containing protein [Synechococcus sp. UW140]|uniref:DUF805 domain-containing protein n=1 Tax=Synechococcus sp. UW140 TaxID=368503 RepID=UPI000E0E46EC|nr:DUF805 domain-containing protein [Synechococcus sp. UW140]
MGPIEAFTTAWRKSFTYGGTATRAEYWWFALVDAIVYVILLIIGTTVFNSTENGILLGLAVIYAIAQIFPSLSITIRRLRDAGKDWVWIFINLVPFIGGFWFLYLLVQPSVVG